MIFRNNTEPEGTVFNVRFIHISDDGRSDHGTAFYAKIPVDKFIAEPAHGGHTCGFWYKLDVEWGKSVFGDYWWMGYRYTEAAENQQKAEIAKLEELLSKVMTVKDFS